MHMHHHLCRIHLALLLALPSVAIFADSQTTDSSPTSRQTLSSTLLLVAKSDFDPFDEGDNYTAPTAKTEPMVEEHAEEREVIDTRPKVELSFEPIKKEESDDDKYKKARMAFLFGQYQMAYKVWEPLAQKGHAKSQATIGWMYHTGKGVEKNMSTAREWYEKAAAQNHVIALNNLGVFYEQGLSVHKSLSEAARFYTEAAELGYSYAQYNLGILYEKGKGLEKDLNLAIYWLQLAALQGVEQASDELLKLSKAKTPNHPDIKIKPDEKVKDVKGHPIWERVPDSEADATQNANADPNSAHSKLYRKLYHGKPIPVVPVVPVDVKQKPVASNATDDSVKGKQGSPENQSKQAPATNETGDKSDAKKPQSTPHSAVDSGMSIAATTTQNVAVKTSQTDSKAIADESWIKQQNPQHYTLQIAASNDLNKLLSLAKTSPLQKELAYYKYQRKGNLWYGLLYGSFEKQSEALAHSKNLPEEYKDWSPWVRKISEVQDRLATSETQQ